MRLFPLVSCLMALLALPAGAAEQAFEGRWDCGIGVFAFTASSYDPDAGSISEGTAAHTASDGVMEILDIAREGDSYILTFEDDYQLSLTVEGARMSWYSPVSGDSFLCSRLP